MHPSRLFRQGAKSLPFLKNGNFALVAEETVELRPGLNVVTGESGAGKSVLVTALGQLLGFPAVDNCIRPPASCASVEGSVHLPASSVRSVQSLLTRMGLPSRILDSGGDSAQELILKREVVHADKGVRSRCSVNGVSTSLRVLRELGAALVDVNGQHAAQTLRDPDTQLALLDRIASTGAAVARYGQKLEELRGLAQQVTAIDALGTKEQREQLQDLMDQVREAEVETGEEAVLRQRLRQMEARQASVQRCGIVRTGLLGDDGSGGVQEGLRSVQTQLNAVLADEEAYAAVRADSKDEGSGSIDEEEDAREGVALMEGALEELEQARDLLASMEQKVGDYAMRFRFLQLEHNEVSQRLAVLDRLFKQHDCSSSDALLEVAAKAEADLDRWFQMEGKREEIERTLRRMKQELAAEGTVLSKRRRAAAGQLRVAVESCLADLAMAGSRFDVRIGWEPYAKGLHVPVELAGEVYEAGNQGYRVRRSGLDAVEFLLAAGPAEPLRPLGAVASGGESARVMFALKAAPAIAAASESDDSSPAQERGAGAGLQSEGDFGTDGASVMILDELDSGVGSRLGGPVGQMLRRMSDSSGTSAASQIICVSHLPQVAAQAEHHIVVRKAVDAEGRALTRFAVLTEEAERAEEVGAMLGLGTSEALQMMQAAIACLALDFEDKFRHAHHDPADFPPVSEGEEGTESEEEAIEITEDQLMQELDSMEPSLQLELTAKLSPSSDKELQADLRRVMHLRQRSAEYQLSHYAPNGAQYVRHRDAFPDDGSEEQQRRVTAILYANPTWCPADGGKLRLWPPRALEPSPSQSSARAGAPAGLSPRASLRLSASPRSNNGDLANGTTQGVGSPSGSGRLMQNGLTQNGLSPDGKPTASGNLLDQPPPMLNGHHHGGLANRNGYHGHAAENGRAAYSDAGSDTASVQSEPPSLRTPPHPPRPPGSIASSMLAEATEASALDSLADGASSVDEGSFADGIREIREAEEPGAKSTEVGTEPVVDVAPLAGRLVLFLSGAVEHAVLPNLSQRIALTAWCQ
ncbi:P-loop containing nucleoside triphosphate hydrolase protein [Coccomyxa subellipsoidea C-169]|uniref:DNA repair protein RecN n=1 Tax=Coccomyxa subellipsoidea (strain C-169) TaxID=574566 RepID=I0Z4L9_COCSC|nr:P-loop containing nucleoside triphosphate hydrolase protein [Coccomyxa subellipsoidea C-169]EIE25588.1 P-loop containing nucleoside triphosphate hydrolase protein [Coccomyxa subellipsoidea C-169]|eukprot:XP_005650132.1 P-loop containing nucleoside triphosphate hydrolase protein [Coccomyxa subellipsoidea C-169]